MSTPTRPSPRQNSKSALLMLFGLIIVAAIAWSIVLPKPAPTSQRRSGIRTVLPQQSSTPEATRIIAHAIKVYATCRSYQDTGTVTTVYPQQHRFDSIKTFRTAFVRPSRFFYEYKTTEGKPKDLYAVWTTGKPVYCWWSRDPGTKIADALFVAMERARSYSEQAAQTVTRMLDPSIGKWSLKELSGVRLIGTEPVDQRSCYKLEGTNEYQDKVTVWIDRQSFLLRRMDRVFHVRDAETANSTQVFTPQVNQPVADSVFTFTPPKQGAYLTKPLMSARRAGTPTWSYNAASARRVSAESGARQ